MSSSERTLLSCFAEQGVPAMLGSLEQDDVVVADPRLVGELDALPTRRCRIVAHADAVDLAAAFRVIVWTGDESAVVARLRAQHPGRRVLGFTADVLPRCAAERPLDAAAESAARGYAILCTPRSGSYYLCSLLERLGFGAPLEHLDNGLCRAARLGLLDLERHFDRLADVAATDGWFGTKLIAHALFEAFDSGFAAPDFLAWLARRRFGVVHLFRRDTVAQAVSNFFARTTGVWLVTGTAPTPVTRPAYDFGEILRDWRELRRQEAWLQHLVGHLPTPPVRVAYEDLDREPALTLTRIVEHLAGDRHSVASDVAVRARTRKQRDAVSAQYAARFAAELQSRSLDDGAAASAASS